MASNIKMTDLEGSMDNFISYDDFADIVLVNVLTVNLFEQIQCIKKIVRLRKKYMKIFKKIDDENEREEKRKIVNTRMKGRWENFTKSDLKQLNEVFNRGYLKDQGYLKNQGYLNN